MNPQTFFDSATALMLVASGALVSAQLLPSVPPKQFGGSVTPAYEGWFDNADGTHSFLIGYFSRNTQAEKSTSRSARTITSSPATPTWASRRTSRPAGNYGVFVFTMPKEFAKTQKITWVLTVNGVRTSVPFYMSPDYNVTPFKSSEESPGGG